MNVDFAMIGNHDLDFGCKNFVDFQKQFETRWIMSNLSLIVKDPETNEIRYEPIGKNEETIIIDHMGYKIGILALVDHNYMQTLINSE